MFKKKIITLLMMTIFLGSLSYASQGDEENLFDFPKTKQNRSINKNYTQGISRLKWGLLEVVSGVTVTLSINYNPSIDDPRLADCARTYKTASDYSREDMFKYQNLHCRPMLFDYATSQLYAEKSSYSWGFYTGSFLTIKGLWDIGVGTGYLVKHVYNLASIGSDTVKEKNA